MSRQQLPEIASYEFEAALAEMAADEDIVREIAEIAREFLDTEDDGL
jgi:hypothetical protein